MPCTLAFIHQIKNLQLLETGIYVSFFRRIRNQIVNANLSIYRKILNRSFKIRCRIMHNQKTYTAIKPLNSTIVIIIYLIHTTTSNNLKNEMYVAI